MLESPEKLDTTSLVNIDSQFITEEGIEKKRCGSCTEYKPLDRFNKDKATKTGLAVYCKDCRKVLRRVYYENGGHITTRWYSLKRRYGITEEEYYAFLEAQGYVCPICLDQLNDSNIHVDHCHNSNKVRGLLCGSCNVGIGHLKEDPMTMLRAMHYLQEG